MEEGDLVPVKDVPISYKQQLSMATESRGTDMAPNFKQRAVAKWNREQLEDRYYCLAEENVTLKRHAINQEDKIKRMATKLIRIINDKKRQSPRLVGPSAKRRDIETEQLVEDLQDRSRELEKHNKLLSDKLMVMRQQLAAQLKRPTFGPYRHVSARVDTGVKPVLRTSSSASHLNGGRTYTKVEMPPMLDEASDQFQEQIEIQQQQIHALKQQLELKDDEIITLKSQLSNEHKQVLHDNVSTIKLQRELKHKASQVTYLEKSCQDLEERLVSANRSDEQLISKIEAANQRLKQSDEDIAALKGQLASFATTNVVIADLKERNNDLVKENQLLKESNERLIESALNADKRRIPVAKEEKTPPVVHDRHVELKTIELEKLNKFLKDQLNEEKNLQEKLELELKEIHLKYEKLQGEYLELELKRGVPKEIGVDELDKALVIIRQQKETALNTQLGLSVEDEEQLDMVKQRLMKEQANHAETIQELEKTRNLLIQQHKINKDYQQEVELVSNRMCQMRQKLEDQLALKVEDLKMMIAKVEKLEKQLEDKVYESPPMVPTKAEDQQSVPVRQTLMESHPVAEQLYDDTVDTTDLEIQNEEPVVKDPPAVVEAPKPRPRTAKLVNQPSNLVVEMTNTGERIPIVVTNSSNCFSSGSSSDSESDIVVSSNRKSPSGEEKMESDSDVIVESKDNSTISKPETPPCPDVAIVVSYLKLSSKSAVMKNSAVCMLFVEYHFLDYPAEELETPFSLPKPKNTKQKLSYNFRKVFHLDLDKQKQLSQMSNSPSKSRITFTVVSEPVDEKEDCEEIGIAHVDIIKVLKNGKDVLQQNIDVYDVKKQTKVIGQLNVTVEILEALRWARK